MRKILLPALAALAATALPAQALSGQAPGKPYTQLVPAPAFSLPAAAGNATGALSAYEGRVRIVDFWATWCPPCREEIPGFVALQKKYAGKGLSVIGLSVDQNRGDVVKFLGANGVNYPVLMADAATQAAYGGIRAIPTTFVIGRKGYVYKHYVGGVDAATFERDVKALL